MDFESFEPIGKGGFGSVYKAFHKVEKREFALKRVAMASCDKKEAKKTIKEVALLSCLHHHHVVRYYQCWMEDSDVSDMEREVKRVLYV